MKRVSLIILILSIGLQVFATPGKDWYGDFVKSFTNLNNEYHTQLSKEKTLYKEYSFNPQSFDLNTGDKIKFSVVGLDFVYISLKNYEGSLRWGFINNPVLVDKQGKKHPVEHVRENVLVGSSSKKIVDGIPRLNFGACIINIPLNGEYVRFEAEHTKIEGNLCFDLFSKRVEQRRIQDKWTKLKTEIVQDYPEAKGQDGLSREVTAGIAKWLTRKNSKNLLAEFYFENCSKAFQQKWEKQKEQIRKESQLKKLRVDFLKSKDIDQAIIQLKSLKPETVSMAINDCKESFGDKFLKADEYSELIKEFANQKDNLLKKLENGDLDAYQTVVEYFAKIDEALLANPLLDFDEIMLIKRDVNESRRRMPKQFGFPSLNSHVNTKINEIGGEWHNTISRLSDIRGDKTLETVIDAADERLITDLELDFNREHVLFSMENENKLWHVYEADMNGKELLCVTPDSLPDVNHFDACYLPNGNIIFTSDASYQGLPCESGSRPMALLYVIDRETGKIRQLTYEQDSDFSPVVLNNGRLMYLRWEYSDLPHYFSRILMSCNPDGTAQMEYYGSNSYFPNTYIYARPIPNHPTQTVGIVGGHHGISRSGRLMIIDPAKGRSEADGVVHEIPHRGRKVEPIIKDQLVAGVWPQFIHPYPLNDKYFLVSAKMNENSLWGIYLVDVFDNMTLIKEVEGAGLFDPIPVRKEKTPPVIPSRVREGEKEANVFITDIYVGDGLKGIPRGTVKSLRLFAYHYAHIATGGHATVGVESSWDVKRVLGTVPVEPDGSANFKVPANTPISIQPLDSAGRALQIMRSWFVGMPGENVSCIGCHERTNQVPPNMFRMAARRGANEIELWQGDVRPFSFRYEVQPVLTKYCVSCHNGQNKSIPDFRRADFVDMNGKQTAEYFFKDKAYMALHPYVRRPGPESDMHMFKPMEYHAGTSELIQLLQRGHHGVKIEDKDWEKLYAWIDLNAPHRGKWSPPEFRDFDQDERRKCLTKRYANVDADPEAEYDKLVEYMENLEVETIVPGKRQKVKYDKVKLSGWPFSEPASIEKQNSLTNSNEVLNLGNDQKITFKGIPAGEFVKGNPKGYADERKPTHATIESSFLMSECEITNAQYAMFDQEHDSRFIDQQWKDHTTPGYPANEPNQPVIRVSYEEALAFCDWLSKKTGRNVTLPTENQWEWACRAGTETDFWYGEDKTDFSTYENFSDYEVRKFAVTGVNPRFIGDSNNRLPQYGFIPRENSVNDGNMITAPVGSYKANSWGLYDMHGNVAEWTLDSYQPTGTDQDRFYNETMKVVKGGSWRDRPKKSKSGSRRYYEAHQKVYNVGFRVVIN